MPVTEVLVATWICNWCARGESHASGTGAGLSAAHFVEVLRWEKTDEGFVTCDRCKAAGLNTPALAATPTV